LFPFVVITPEVCAALLVKSIFVDNKAVFTIDVGYVLDSVKTLEVVISVDAIVNVIFV